MSTKEYMKDSSSLAFGYQSQTSAKSPPTNNSLVSDSEESDDNDTEDPYDNEDDADSALFKTEGFDLAGDNVPESLLVGSSPSANVAKPQDSFSSSPSNPLKNPIKITRTRILQPAIHTKQNQQQRQHTNKSVVFDSSTLTRPYHNKRTLLPLTNDPPLASSSDQFTFGFPDVTAKFSAVRDAANDYFVAASNAALPKSSRPRINFGMIDPKEQALWKWTNVDQVDSFLRDIYSFYLGNGFYCILLSRALNMATILFVVSFSTYLSACIDYSKISTSSKLSQVQYPQCAATRLSPFATFLLWMFALFWFVKLIQYVHDVKRLLDLKNFYFHLLKVSDSEMQTISWQQIVKRLILLRDQNPQTSSKISKKNARFIGYNKPQPQKLGGPQDVANRIMRKENYMIAMINKNVLDLSIPVPFNSKLFSVFPFDNKPFLTRTLEWNLSLCIMDFVFDGDELRPGFLKEANRKKLSDALRRRFILAGFANIICAPITVVYMTLLYFFRYFNEYHKDPSSIGTRQYTPLAEWKMREFNELHHMFQRRLHLSYDPASKYVNQFPKEKTVIFSRFVVFVCGSFAAVLGIISLIDPELFLGFEISQDRTVLFYIGLFGSILAVARGMIPDSSEMFLFDPETSLKNVVEYTHYLPDEWAGQYHTDYVKNEFSELYDLKIMIILRELLSVIVTPFILWWSLTKSTEKIVDFFREFSVYVDGLGYVCTFATFDFSLNGKRGAKNLAKPKSVELSVSDIEGDLQEEEALLTQAYHSTADGKMLKSYLNFLENYGGNGVEKSGHFGGSGMDGSNFSVSQRFGGNSSHWGVSSVARDRRGLPVPIHNNTGINSGSFYGADSTASGMHFNPMENSVMGRFNRIQHQHGIRSGQGTPLNRSGIFGLPAELNTGGASFETGLSTANGWAGRSQLNPTYLNFSEVSVANAVKPKPRSPLQYFVKNNDSLQNSETLEMGGLEGSEGTVEAGKYDVGSSSYTGEEEDKGKKNEQGVTDNEEDEFNGAGNGVLGILNQFYDHNDVTRL